MDLPVIIRHTPRQLCDSVPYSRIITEGLLHVSAVPVKGIKQGKQTKILAPMELEF